MMSFIFVLTSLVSLHLKSSFNHLKKGGSNVNKSFGKKWQPIATIVR